MDEAAKAIAGMAGRDGGSDNLAESVSSVASTPRGGGQQMPDHHPHTGLGCPADYCCFSKGADGMLVVRDPYQTSRRVGRYVSRSVGSRSSNSSRRSSRSYRSRAVVVVVVSVAVVVVVVVVVGVGAVVVVVVVVVVGVS